MAWFGLVAGQVHAMARHQTADGKGDLHMPLTRLWSGPARKLFSPLLDWASPDVVYVTWGKIWLPVFVAFTLCAFIVHHRRQPIGFERWAWRVALTGYVGMCVSVAVEYWTSYAKRLPAAPPGDPAGPGDPGDDRDHPDHLDGQRGTADGVRVRDPGAADRRRGA
jgi:hypothetical protein